MTNKKTPQKKEAPKPKATVKSSSMYKMSASTKQMLTTFKDPVQRAAVKKLMIEAEQKAEQTSSYNRSYKQQTHK